MFVSILDTTSGTISLESAAICIAAAVILGLVAAFTYTVGSERCTKNFVVTLALLPLLVEVVILMTSGNLGTAVAVAGAFSLVRFRSVPGTSKEILAVFFAMAIGLACGMGQVLFAGLFTVLVSLIMLVLQKMNLGTAGSGKLLKVTIPEDLDYTEIFDDIFRKYTSRAELLRVRTVNLGSMYELDYDVILKNDRDERKMIDDIRVRNGNLTIVCGRHPEKAEQL